MSKEWMVDVSFDITKLSKTRREFLYYLILAYEGDKRIGKKCRACGHIQGDIFKKGEKDGWKPSKFCYHHYDTIDSTMKRMGYDKFLLFDLYGMLKEISSRNTGGKS